LLCLGLSDPQVFDAPFQGGDLAEPCALLCLDEALFGVVCHLVDAAQLGGVDAQKPAPGARMFVHARCAVWAVAFAKPDPTQQEALLELRPFVLFGDTILADRAQLSPSFDDGLVGGDEVLREHCGVAAGGVEVEVAQQRSGDVQRQTSVDGVGGGDSAKVVRGEPDWLAGVAETSYHGQVVEDAAQALSGITAAGRTRNFEL
jgi:hypothetical protein